MSELKKLVEVVQQWHANRLDQLNTIIDTPDTTEVRLGDDENPIILTGDKLKGFRMGIIVAKSMFEALPFTAKERSIDELVTALIAERLGLEVAEVGAESSLSDDLGADSLDMVEMVMDAEEAFKIDLADEDVEEIKTVQQAIDAVRKALA